MAEPLVYHLHDIVEMKKPHACGSNAWEITRVGADIKLTCTNCGRGIMMPRFDFNKRLKKVLKSADRAD
ncbi:DUF951 domain-containing protein [Leuconostoc carnosum]|uniref:DUF951 domain-containing protein n=2 Tax=Leuconostoc carnosum TaxID=1252 RepID=K0DE75_LEUCJ|nr:MULTISPECIES: DUF951 domain-containing protein [Leuconostoc]AFT82261.1 hypothetical protein C270_06760 [Leuconostoc carnosum JB16]KAA8324861.1 DUF951 domain-containing protein [Leuconostoc carnosum]KAA8327837.1 DUF951 domain-containing protein [Leuconostoc carnosum]KAA8358797.1 DUF951 domain-containing protein [Leuconostoc carnosum]KAA8364967.1 DUF951 domain-containing protein [Leuconostoc carnosum]